LLLVAALLLAVGINCQEAEPEFQFTNYVDDGIYRIDINILLKEKYANEEQADCVTADLKQRKVVAKFYHPRLANNHNVLMEKLEPYLAKSEANCQIIQKQSDDITKEATELTTEKGGANPLHSKPSISKPEEPQKAKDDLPTWAILVLGICGVLFVVALIIFGMKNIQKRLH